MIKIKMNTFKDISKDKNSHNQLLYKNSKCRQKMKDLTFLETLKNTIKEKTQLIKNLSNLRMNNKNYNKTYKNLLQ